MLLKKLEIYGFKSFADKFTFDFKEGITCIVGPNGSGKSNVSDAVRWVLGEQSAKNLRGGKMEDVIFAGTEIRKPMGFASVSIYFDNADRSLNMPYDEVVVSRRVYRSGESEYKINGAACRLRDIEELFYDTGVGQEGYSIIGQGRIDRILSGKKDDKRELFEEAASIVTFKKRKEKAIKELKAEEENLTRIRDINVELEARLEPLREASENARKYLSLYEELKEFDKQKTKVFKYITYKKRTEQEIRNKFRGQIHEDMLEDIIQYLKEAKYIDDGQYIEKTINNFMILKNLSIKEIQYKLISKGLNKNLIEDYIYNENEELNNYEIKSAKNIIYKKSNTMELEDIKVYLIKKGYKIENINSAIEQYKDE